MHLGALNLLPLVLFAAADADGTKPFAIQVVDEATGRGVPLIELRTTNDIRLYTDSHGIVAFWEPGLMGQKVFFHVRGHGYEYPKDGFGYSGVTLTPVSGGRAQIRIRRINVAERLYRITGAGIYRDSILVGDSVPIRQPLLNAKVTGSDSVVCALFKGKIYWFWGDTNRPRYPLGNFHVPGATSELPGSGGLDPDVGIDLDYFLGDEGFARPTAKLPGEGPTWISGLVVLGSDSGKDRMFAHYVKVKDNLNVYERGLVEFDDETKRFKHRATFPEKEPFPHGGHPLLHTVDGVRYIYFCDPYPLIRVVADPEHLKRQESYEAFTPLARGSRPESGSIERDEEGAARFRWKVGTSPLRSVEQEKLIRAGKLRREDTPFALRDVDTGKTVLAHRGSVYWNTYRRRWVMVAGQTFGTSMLGEIWYAQADTLLGPWIYARKIVTHEDYSLYNPKHHPFFGKEGGRFIYFEGTYTASFSGSQFKTPRYDYNQIMYRLDLTDPRLNLPVAVYEKGTSGAPDQFVTGVESTSGLPIAFWALERAALGTVPVYSSRTSATAHGLRVGAETGRNSDRTTDAEPLFHALPVTTSDPPETTVPLYEFVHTDGVRRAYATPDRAVELAGYQRSDEPLVLVWR